MAAWVGEDAPINTWVKWECWLCLPQAQHLGEQLPVPHVGSAIEPILLTEMWVSQAQNSEHRSTFSIIHLSCGGMVQGEMPFSFPSRPNSGGKAGPDVRRAGELPLPTTNWNTWEYRLCTSLGQDNKANPIGRDLGKPVVTLWTQKSFPHYSPVM